MKITGLKDTIDWYDRNADQYSAKADTHSFDDQAKSFLAKLPENPKVLDAGCGNGRDSKTLHDLGADVSGLDLSQGLLEVAKNAYPDIDFTHGTFLNLPYPDNSFDGIWSHASLVHLDTLDDVESSLAEFARVIQPKGLLYIRVKKQTGEAKTEVTRDTLSNHDRFFRYYTEEELEKLLTNAGFKLENIDVLDDIHGREEVKWIRLFAVRE